MPNLKLQAEQIAQFERDGVLVLKSVYDPDHVVAVQESIYDIIGLVLKRHNLPDTRKPFSPEAFDDGFNDMIRQNRGLGAEVYDAVKQIPAFIRLLSHPLHEQIMRQLRPGSLPGVAAGGYGIRIDNPNEDQFRTFWHQEYPAQLRSLNGIVFWSPLLSITPELGPVKICPGSQAEGAIPVFAEVDGDKRQGAYSLKLHNEKNVLSKYAIIDPLSVPTDLILLDFLVIHSSGYNRGIRSRWTIQFRYFDFNEPVGMSHGWKGSYASGVDFRTIHPELCID